MKNLKGSERYQLNLLKFNLKIRLTLFSLLVSFFSIRANTHSGNIKINPDLKNVSNTKTIEDSKKRSVEIGYVSIQQSISGIVTDTNGQPIPGVSVVEKGTSNGAATDFDGNYSLTVSSANAILTFSSIGFTSKEVPVGTNTTINIQLEENAEALKEVVVVAYGTSTKKDLTGAVSVISSEELNNFATTTVDQALQGKTSGVQITANSGAPGSSVTVNIRGVGSFGSTTPLYIVDGFPTQDISFINPNTIESLSVLKDASATALYGVRASNGVVIIETKKGKKGRVNVELNSFLGVRTKPKSVDVLDVNRFSSLALELSGSSDSEIAGSAIPYDGWNNSGSLRNIDWQDEVFSEAISKSTTLSIRGGGEKSRVALNLGFYDEEGTLIGSEYKRYDAGLNAQFDVTDKVRFKGSVKYISSQNFQPLGSGRGSLLNLYGNIPHLAPVGELNLNGDPNLSNVPVDGNGNFGAYPDVGSETFRDGRNFVARALEDDRDNITNDILANISAEWDIIDGLSTRVNIGARATNFAGWVFNPQYYRSNGNIDLRNNAVFTVTQNTFNEILAEHIFQYKKTFATKHNLDVLAGYSAQRGYTKFTQIEGTGFLNNRIRDIAQAQDITNRQGSFARETLASTFARLNYNFDSKYYATATIRRDGVGNRFLVENAWDVFPSFAAGWNIDEEDFMEGSIFNVLKFRGSWGETGNFFGIAPFVSGTTFSNGTPRNDSSYSFGGNTTQSLGLAPVSASNSNLRWETQVQSNIGFDGELLNNKIYFTVDYFNRKSKDILFDITTPGQSGFPTRPVNGATAVNEGFEFLVGYRKDEGDFTFDINANITTIKNEITKIDSPVGQIRFNNEFLDSFNESAFWFDITRSELGGEVGSFYGFVADGIYQSQAEIDALNTASPNGNYQAAETSPGDRRFRDLNGDGQITGEDREVIGSPIPDFYGSLNLNFAYKNFDLGLNFYGTYGNEILNLVKRELESASGYGNSASFSNVSTEYFNNRWTVGNPSNTFSRALIDDGSVQNNRASSYFVEDGSYFRLRNINLGYTLPSEITDKIGLNSFRLYLSAQNLFTITDYSGSDPEVGQNSDIQGQSSVTTRGIDAGAYPVSRFFTLGFNLKF
ncbi:SusC/RagA family TonB-linked outer membrane protein [Aquimarina algiphila]|uniref:SusC/RagA family TonB-linked outer membrane protein n=1 Tax=Aquimarina algiphila TaxID=2047982 RepID=UPI00248FB0C7|nr:TonB-dependent receptor [Aquimarina algiphila]